MTLVPVEGERSDEADKLAREGHVLVLEVEESDLCHLVRRRPPKEKVKRTGRCCRLRSAEAVSSACELEQILSHADGGRRRVLDLSSTELVDRSEQSARGTLDGADELDKQRLGGPTLVLHEQLGRRAHEGGDKRLVRFSGRIERSGDVPDEDDQLEQATVQLVLGR